MARSTERSRHVAALVEARLRRSPAVVLVGPRQVGKTTLARSLTDVYFDLEQPGERVRLDATWDEIASERRLVVLDEAQSWPDLFPRLRGAIDASRGRMGRFLLLGSVSPALMRQVSESLAGRLAIVEMTPFLASELDGAQRTRHWLMGGFPDGGVLAPSRFPGWENDYLALLSQRDLPEWGLPARASLVDRTIRMLALAHGQTWNASAIGQSLGISYHTVNAYLDVLEGAFLFRRLLPFHANVGKRLTRAPKLFLRDTGLLHAIHGVRSERELLQQPWVGASFEGYVIEQILGELSSRGIAHHPWFFRTSDGYELDLLLEIGRQRWAIEVKLTTAPSPSDVERVEKVAALAGATRRAIVCRSRVTSGRARTLVADVRSVVGRIVGETMRGWPRRKR